jgi:hypothetical protein
MRSGRGQGLGAFPGTKVPHLGPSPKGPQEPHSSLGTPHSFSSWGDPAPPAEADKAPPHRPSCLRVVCVYPGGWPHVVQGSFLSCLAYHGSALALDEETEAGKKEVLASVTQKA